MHISYLNVNMPINIFDATSLTQVIDIVRNEVFGFIQYEKNEKITEEEYQSIVYEIVAEEVDGPSRLCNSVYVKKWIEEYGTFKALKEALDEGFVISDHDIEDDFYTYFLFIHLYRQDYSYDSYKTYCEKNPLSPL